MANSRTIIQDHFSYSQKGKDGAFSPSSSTNQLVLYLARVLNRSGASLNAAVTVKLDNGSWKMWNFDDSGSSASDVSTTIQAGTGVTLFTAANDGFIVQANRVFNMVGVNISTAQSGSTTHAFEYWNGTAYAALPSLETIDFESTGTNLITFLAPHDWAVGGDPSGDIDQTLYSVKITSDAAPATTDPIIDDMWVGKFLVFQDTLKDNQALEIGYAHDKPLTLQVGESIMPYFSTANSGNSIMSIYSEI